MVGKKFLYGSTALLAVRDLMEMMAPTETMGLTLEILEVALVAEIAIRGMALALTRGLPPLVGPAVVATLGARGMVPNVLGAKQTCLMCRLSQLSCSISALRSLCQPPILPILLL